MPQRGSIWFEPNGQFRPAVSHLWPRDPVSSLSSENSGSDADRHLLVSRHGAFEADPDSKELVHLQSGRHWRQWDGEWYRQHNHPDGIRFEIHEALDRLYTEGYRARG